MTIFCYVCKRHVPVTGEKHEDRLKQFRSFGHDNTKVKKLKRGLIGV